MKTVDVGPLLDEGRFTGYQKLLIFFTALTIILDGIDNQLLPNAIPRLMQEWNRPRGDFLGALGWGPFGMMIGGVVGGVIGDRLGRRTALLASIITFAVLTLIISFVPAGDVSMLALLRFLAGVGLGGAMPNAATLSSEYVPRKQRPFAVTMTIICIPLGGVVAGEMAARIIPDYGWRMLFQIGGVLPLVLAAVLWKVLPESPRYLAARRERWPDLTLALRKMGHDIPADVAYADAGASTAPTKSGHAMYYVLAVAGVTALWQLGFVQGMPMLIAAGAVSLVLLGLAVREFSPQFRIRHRGPVRVVLLLPDGQLRDHPAARRPADAAWRLPAAAGEPRAVDLQHRRCRRCARRGPDHPAAGLADHDDRHVGDCHRHGAGADDDSARA